MFAYQRIERPRGRLVSPSLLRKDLTAAERERLLLLIARQERVVQQRFQAFLRAVRSEDLLRQIIDDLARGNIENVLRVMDSHIVALSDFVPRIFNTVASDEVETLFNQIFGQVSRVATSFDPTHPRAVQLMRRNRLEFIREFTRQQRNVTRTALVDALNRGSGIGETARAFRDTVGTTQHQLNMVNNYRNLLESQSREALNRALRDRRFDPTIRRAIETNTPLARDQINRMVDRYYERLLAMRSETIARTETHKILNQARQEALEQTLEQVGIEEDRVERVWSSTLDDRTRDTHGKMNGQRRGMHEHFVSPSGARLMQPGDPNAPAAEIINCRCVVAINFK